MKKKIFALALAAVMLVSGAMTAMAATEVDCSGWWIAHSEGYEVTAEGVTLEFKSTTYADATANWNTPIYVIYSADEAFAGGAAVSTAPGYAEYFVMRSDLYGWSGAAIDASLTGKNTNDAEYANLITKEGVPADDAAWATWLTANKAGVDCKVTAKLDGSNAVVTIENNGVKSTAKIPVDTSKKVYVSLGGELCKLTNIKTVEDAPANPDVPAKGDMSSVMTYVVLFFGAALVVVAARKRFA